MLTKRIAFSLFAITVAVLTALVAWLTLSVRAQLRTVFIEQHGEILQPLAAAQLEETRETLLLTGDLIEASELLALVLGNVSVDALVDVRLFDVDGLLIADDFAVSLSVVLHPNDCLRAMQGLPSSRYHATEALQALFPEGGLTELSLGVPLIEVVVPLRDDEDKETIAMARYLLNGEETASDLAAMDDQLLTMAVSLLVPAFLLLGGLFYWAFRQLERSRGVIEQSHQCLIELNHQLAFADKSSAVGTLTAHLVHGLKNPLAALGAVFEEPISEENRKHGRDRVHEAQRMIDHLVDVMRDEESALVYEYRLEEVREMLVEKTLTQSRRAEVKLDIGTAPDRTLTGRQGNVLLLILVNLIDNAIEASSAGSQVRVTFAGAEEGPLAIKVRDLGKGIPKELQERLFVPKRSGKDQGAGIGLVIAAQLARQIGGELRLEETGLTGTCFSMTMSA
ncbi:MAG: signal transduction histidine kinase [Verrucomicrobiales bacterium]